MRHFWANTLIATCLVALCGSPTSAQTLGPHNVSSMADTYRQNEVRFNRDYLGKQFDGVLPFRTAREGLFNKNKYTIGFGTGSFLSDVDCTVSDRNVINRIVDWNAGDSVRVTGVVKGMLMGAVQLDQCTFSK